MNDGLTRFSYGSLSQAEADLRTAYQTIRTELDDLTRYLGGTLQLWQGDDETTYGRFRDQWNAAAEDMNHVLAALGVAIGEIKTNYQAAERANAAMWAG